MKTYLIIETYKPGKTIEIVKRLQKKGRMLPAGVAFVDSWVEQNLQKCYQIMKSDSLEKINHWVDHWNDLVDFEVIPVLTSAEATKAVLSDKK